MIRGWRLVQPALLLVFVSPFFAQQPVVSSRDVSSMEEVRRLIATGNFAEAEHLLHKLPPSADAHESLAYTLLRENKPAESLTEYTRAAALRSPSAEDLKNVAQAYALLNDYPDALKWSGRAVAMDSSNPEAWYSLGRIQYTQQMYEQAVESFQRVLALAPQSVKAENNLGLAYEGLNQQENAIDAYRQAITWQSAAAAQRSEQPLLNLAILLLHRQQLREAEPLLREAVSLAPNDARVHEQLGHLYLQQGAYTAARAELEVATKLDPGNSSLHFLLGQAYRRLGLPQQAQQEFAASARLAAVGGGAVRP